MALTIDFTNIDVKLTQPKQFRISAVMELKDGANVLFPFPFGCDYKPGNSITDRIDIVKKELQEALDNFGLEYQLKNNPTLASKLNALKKELNIPQL